MTKIKSLTTLIKLKNQKSYLRKNILTNQTEWNSYTLKRRKASRLANKRDGMKGLPIGVVIIT